MFFPSLLQVILASVGFALLCCNKCYLEIHQTKINPFKNILKVIIYTLTHKHPERRSALTYWESKIPSRIDFGKQKYGGPFTNEEVEDMKAFFRLLLVIFLLFGFFLTSDMQSFTAPFLIQRIGCPRLTVFMLLIMNSDHLKIVIVLLGIPLYHSLLKKKCIRKYIPNLLTKIGIGLFLRLVQESFNPLFSYLINPTNQGPLQCEHQALKSFMSDSSSSISLCILANGKGLEENGTCGDICSGIINE